MTDEYATLRAAFHAGATIDAFRVPGDDGQTPLDQCGDGEWCALPSDVEPVFGCHPTRYRVKPEGLL